MYLSELLESDLVLPKISCSSKDELISIVLEKIYSTGKGFPLPQEDVLKTIYLREKIGGTMLPSGLSVPHARLQDYEGFVLALATPTESIIHDGIQIRLMAIMLSSQEGGPYYLPCLAALTKLSRDLEHFSRLCDTEKSEDLISVIKERDPELL